MNQLSERELKDLYETKVAPSLQKVAGNKKKAQKFGCLILLCFSLIIVGIVLINKEVINGYYFLLIIVVAIAGMVYFWKKSSREMDIYSKNFFEAIELLLNKTVPNWKYSRDKHISMEEYRKSGIQTGKFSNLKGDDLLEGSVNGYDFKCSEIKVTKTVRSGKNNSRQQTIFSGAMIYIPLESIFRGKTYLSTKNEKLNTALINKLFNPARYDGFKTVSFDDGELDSKFEVRTTYPEEAKLLISDKNIKFYSMLRNEINDYFEIGFNRECVVCCFNLRREAFEISGHKLGISIDDFKFFYRYHYLVHNISLFITEIIDDFKQTNRS